ncbi:hypothetical protein F5Y06DRAFT_300955 [Hypoxylon sp. FL0890]|nr:hypothetical protein F5Y06DRAFT_300955 [Hypoxylon sp. FL0890]
MAGAACVSIDISTGLSTDISTGVSSGASTGASNWSVERYRIAYRLCESVDSIRFERMFSLIAVTRIGWQSVFGVTVILPAAWLAMVPWS